MNLNIPKDGLEPEPLSLNGLSSLFFVTGIGEPRQSHFQAITRQNDCLLEIYRILPSIPGNPIVLSNDIEWEKVGAYNGLGIETVNLKIVGLIYHWFTLDPHKDARIIFCICLSYTKCAN